MAKTLILGALLSALLSSHGVWGTSGCKVPAEGLQAFCLGTKDHWVPGLQGALGQVPISVLSGGLLNCRIVLLTFESIRVSLVPGFGLHVLVCLKIQVRCVAALLLEVRVTVKLCGTLRLKIGPHGLVVDGCSVAYSELSVDPLISLQLSLLVNALDGLLSGPFCKRALEICVQLNYLLDFDGGPYPFPVGCQCTYRKYSPVVTNLAIEFRFNPVLSCDTSTLPFPLDPGYVLPLAGVPHNDLFLVYVTQSHFTFWVESMQRQQVFDDDDSLGSTVTTTSVMERIPAVTPPRGLPIMIKMVCAKIYVELHAGRALLCFTFHIAIGYNGPSGFVRLFTLTVTGKFLLRVTIDCPKRQMLPTVEVSSDFQITGSCEGRPCSLVGSDMESLFGLKARCLRLLNLKLSAGFPWMLPRRYGCDSCQRTVYISEFIYWPCALRLL